MYFYSFLSGLLQYFNQRKINVLGIEPAANVAKVAIKNGINTKIDFFTKDLALNLKNDQKQADLIVANNVLAHVPELNNFVNGIKILLKNITHPKETDRLCNCSRWLVL